MEEAGRMYKSSVRFISDTKSRDIDGYYVPRVEVNQEWTVEVVKDEE